MFTILYGNSLSDIREWMREQSIETADFCVFEDDFYLMMGSQYEKCWSQIPSFYKYVICKTNDAIKCAPAEYPLIRIGRSARISDRGQLISHDHTQEMYQLMYP